MIKYVTAWAIISTLAPSASAERFYIGVNAGLALGRSNDVDETVDYYSGVPARRDKLSLKYDDVFGLEYAPGVDLDVVGGTDFGWLRVEGELAKKRVELRRNVEDDNTDQFLGEVNLHLHRPPGSPAAVESTLPALTIADFQPSGVMRVSSAMLNALLDYEITERVTISGGGGLGRSWAKGFDDQNEATSWQYLISVRYAVSDHAEVGLKYRYFNSGIIKLNHQPIAYAGNASLISGPENTITQPRSATITPSFEGEFRTRSLLVSFIHYF